MQRFPLSDLRIHIAVALNCLPKPVRRGAGLSGEAAVKETTDRVMEILSRAAILMPDDVTKPGTSHEFDVSHGTFGVSEPWPFEREHRPPKGDYPPYR